MQMGLKLHLNLPNDTRGPPHLWIKHYIREWTDPLLQEQMSHIQVKH